MNGSAAAAPAVLAARGLTKTYARGRIRAVAGVGLTVDRGEVFGLIGPDGAGKTTVLQILAGVLSADSGAAIVAGADVIQHPESVKGSIGYMPQGLGLNLYDDLAEVDDGGARAEHAAARTRIHGVPLLRPGADRAGVVRGRAALLGHRRLTPRAGPVR